MLCKMLFMLNINKIELLKILDVKMKKKIVSGNLASIQREVKISHRKLKKKAKERETLNSLQMSK